MPELPEVETVKKGLEPYLEEAIIKDVRLNRKNLRFDFAKNFTSQLRKQQIKSLSRRGKYLIFSLKNDMNFLVHLGMSGNFIIIKNNDAYRKIKHCHVEFLLTTKEGEEYRLLYIDPRRFGFMELFTKQSENKFLQNLGVEPLSNELNAQYLAKQFFAKKSEIKSALLNQKIIAGLGNIYVCEALWRAKIYPREKIAHLVKKNYQPTKKLEKLSSAIKEILAKAIKAGGSTISDFHSVNEQSGYFQHYFAVYNRAGEKCSRKKCNAIIVKISQGGRSTFFCPKCQKP